MRAPQRAWRPQRRIHGNDQLLARRQRARPPVAIGLQDRRRGDVVAARQDIQRVAGADDDRSTRPGGRMGGGDRTRRDGAGGFDRMCRRSVGGDPSSAAGNPAAGRRIALRCCDRRRQGPATGIAAAGGNIAEARGARPRAAAPNRWLQAARQRDGEGNSARAASACRRCSRQTRTRSAPAPRRAGRDASKATRRYGTWLLTRTQQMAFLSKHAPVNNRLTLRILTLPAMRGRTSAEDAPEASVARALARDG